MGNFLCRQNWLSFQADHLKAHRILFSIRFLVNEAENIFGVCPDRSLPGLEQALVRLVR